MFGMAARQWETRLTAKHQLRLPTGLRQTRSRNHQNPRYRSPRPIHIHHHNPGRRLL